MNAHCMFPVVDFPTGDVRFCRRRPDEKMLELELCQQHAYRLLVIVRRHEVDCVAELEQSRLDRVAEQAAISAEMRLEHEKGRVVYYIRRPDGAIKIGSSVNALARMKALEGSIRPLQLLATHPGDFSAEKAMHRRFAAHRLDGEWFAPVDELLAHIAKVNERHAESSAA